MQTTRKTEEDLSRYMTKSAQRNQNSHVHKIQWVGKAGVNAGNSIYLITH